MAGRQADNLFHHTRHQLLIATALAVGSVLWVHGVLTADQRLSSHTPYLVLDALLALPAAGAAIWIAERLRRRLGLGTGLTSRAGLLALVFTALAGPLAIVQAFSHQAIGTNTGAAGHHHAGAGITELAGYGLSTALQIWPAVLVTAVAAVAAQRLLTDPRARRRLVARLAASRRPLVVAGSTLGLAAGIGAAAVLPASPAVAQSGGCSSAPQRTYNVAAINVEITVNRHGDYDPFGFMYVLQSRINAVRDFENRLRVASQTADIEDPATGLITTPWPELVAGNPNAALVSSGLGQDVIQPLVLRARLGECVVINLRNDLTRAPVTGPAGRLVEVPGGVPDVSIDMQGVSYSASQGGQSVGTTNGAVMAAPGQTRQYRFFLDPVMGEGTKVFRSGGDSTQLTAHGLFGALIAEPAGARWFDPDTGAERTNDANWSNWAAMVQASGQPTFREFTILYHEIGDESYTLRRPLREVFGAGAGAPVPDPFDDSANPRLIGGSLPMIDRRQPDAGDPFFRGANTSSYRPSSRGLNYRSESFFRRLQHEALLVDQAGGTIAQAAREQLDNKSLSYSSYSNGDPATPIPRSYLGEPTKTRLAHVGFEQLHVHHLHGGATRWRQNPGADNTDIAGGLKKVPIQNAQSIRLDSQTISPEESFSLEHECGAGGCQQAAGDFLYHCHIAHHYIAGMWGFWRVFDTRQTGLAALPGRPASPQAVTSAGLLGRTIEGRTVVLDSQVTNPNTQVGLETLVEGQLPPQGARLNKQDATVWDWVRSGPANAPVYLGEPEVTRAWENYRSPTPGERPQILFNPNNGRPAYPLLRPHLGQRPPFSPGEHSGAPWLGNTGSTGRPDGLCPAAAPVREYDITAVSLPIQMTNREIDPGGMLFTLNEDKEDLLNGDRPADPLTIRSNVGDCVAITFGNQIDNAPRIANGLKELAKTNMHTHFVQFDPQASDGVITGLSYEQSVFPAQRDGRTLVSVNDADTITVSQVTGLRPGIAIAVGLGTENIEIRTIESISGNALTFDRPLQNSHAAGVPVTVEFTQHRWFSDVDSGTVFWHDHVDGIVSWSSGLFAAHIIEPPGSTYHDPVTGAEVKSGTIVDIHAPSTRSVGVGQSGDFREYMLFLHNGRNGVRSSTNFKFGQESEEGTINLQAEPLGERTPPGTVITSPAGEPLDTDPTTTDQRFQFNGFDAVNSSRNAFDRTGPSRTNTGTVAATVTTVDPHVFSSVTYGDPRTPLLRAYAGDDVVIRTIGLGERGEALRMQGHRFRMERFNTAGQLMDTAVTGISERFDYVLDGGAGGPQRRSGDYLYYSTRTFALESGAWGIFRVHDRREGDLQPLRDNTPPTGNGFPILAPNTASNPQADPGPAPPPPSSGVVSDNGQACPGTGENIRIYSVTAFDHQLPSEPFPDTEGIVYALTVDVAAIQAGTKPIEPLVLRANQGDCVIIRLRNRIDPNSLYGGSRAGFDLGMLLRNPQISGGAAIGLNPDTTVASGLDGEYRFLADREVGTTIFQNLGSPAALRHGAYGLLIVEPTGSVWRDSVTGATLSTTATSTEAIIDPPGSAPAFREFALTMQTTDQQYGRSIVPYMDVVAGNGINPARDAGGGQVTVRLAPIAGAPPGTRDTHGSYNKGFNHINYRTEPLTVRLGWTDAPGFVDLNGDGLADTNDPSWSDPGFALNQPPGTALSSAVHGDPATPILEAHAGDPVVIRLGVAASDQLHAFTVSGHMYPLEPEMWNGTTDRRSQLMTSRTVTAGQALDVELVGGAGGPLAFAGDYAYRDGRQPWTAAGMWGILRVLPDGSSGITPLP